MMIATERATSGSSLRRSGCLNLLTARSFVNRVTAS
jgi:hypothetical protein